MLPWNLNGLENGPGGSEFLTFQILDEFLHIPGNCPIYQGSLENRWGVPKQYRDVFNALAHGRETRFNTFLLVATDEVNPLSKVGIL